MNKSLAIFIGFAIFSTINLVAQDLERELEKLIQTDIKFSEYSVKFGINMAFVEFADDSAVLLKPNSLPIIGIDAVKKYHSKLDDSNITLSWKPLNANISKSSDLGYTYGTWQLKSDNINQEGTYVSIWAKNKNDQWKYILDTGNSGLGNEKE